MYQINAVNSGAYRAFNKITDFANEKPENTSIFNAAEKKAEKEDDKTAITIMLEDFSEKLKGTNGKDKSNLSNSFPKTTETDDVPLWVATPFKLIVNDVLFFV